MTKAARLLGVHANTIRTWSDQGRLRYYRINPRGDRRYRLADLQRFMTAAEAGPISSRIHPRPERPGARTATLAARPTAREGRFGGGGVAGGRGTVPGWAPSSLELDLLARVTAFAAETRGLANGLAGTVGVMRENGGLEAAGIWQRQGERLILRAAAGPVLPSLRDLPVSFGILGRALASDSLLASPGPDPRDPVALAIGGPRAAIPIDDDGTPWGVLLAVGREGGAPLDGALWAAIGNVLTGLVARERLAGDLERKVHQAEALRRVAADIGSKLDLDQILSGLIDHALVLFGADRGAVFLTRPDGRVDARGARNLSEAYLRTVADFPRPSLPAEAIELGRPLFATGYRDDERWQTIRSAVIQEGYDTICAAPLGDGDGSLGVLILYHDQPHPWPAADLETVAALAAQAAIAIRTAQDFARMATWAAQLQSIQQLGTRLSRLTRVQEIGIAIATELRQLIDYHNVRVYRLYGDDLIPVAMQGQVGEYVDETAEQLRIGVGEGITGWVARHGLAQNLADAAHDPRAVTIPGTEDDLDESMLLAPMLYEDQVLGVLVLSKLGLHQFTDDDLRLLVIYASFAAQAMANADATERLRAKSAALERQLRSQRVLLQITESILTTLDPRAILEQITDRLAALVRYDDVTIDRFDRVTGRLEPLTARGVHAAELLAAREPRESSLGAWVLEHGEGRLVPDVLAEGRHDVAGPLRAVEGSRIVVPLRDRGGVAGVLTLERLGPGDRFDAEEFELVKLFAAQVSIALQNAETHHAVEIRAQTDDLTGLLNQGTFHEWLTRAVHESQPFSLIMLDLDDFKLVNDRMGHAAGDELLRRIAAAVVAAGRESDRVFRYGGDELTILLPATDQAGARQVAERVREALRGVRFPQRRAGELEVTASIGIASYPSDGETPMGILIAADRACYVSKRDGRDRVAVAKEGLALAADFSLQEPTPVDRPSAA